MKKLSAIVATALIALTVSMPVYAEPSEGSTEEASVQQSTQQSDESSAENSDNEASKSESSKSEEKTDEKSKEEKTDKKTSDVEVSEKNNSEDTKKASLKAFRVEEAEMNISLPDNMYVITRDTNADDPAFENYKRSKNEIMESFKESDIYIKASEKDFSCDITVTVVENGDTEAVKNLSSLSDNELQSVIDNLLKQDVYKGCSKTSYNNTLFLTLTMEDESNDTKISGIQEYTIINGRRVIITFQAYDGEIDEAEKNMFKEVMNSIKFDGVEAEPQSSSNNSLVVNEIDIRYIYIIIASTIALAALLIMIIAGMKYKKSKRLAAAQDDEETEISGTKIERNTTALVDNESDDNNEPEDIFSDSEIEKSSEAGELYTDDNIPVAPLTYEKIEEQEFALGSIDENNVSVTELPEETPAYDHDSYTLRSTKPEGFTEIKASPSSEEMSGYSNLTDGEYYSEQQEGLYDYDGTDYAEYEEYSEKNPNAEDDVVFAEITEKRHTEIEQIGISEPYTEEQNTEQSDEEDTNEELSAYEKRFGKKRTTPAVTASAAASPDIMIVNTDEKRASKFEKHFGKLTPAVKPEEMPEPALTETVSSESDSKADKLSAEMQNNEAGTQLQESEAAENEEKKQEDVTENKLFTKLIDKLKNHNVEDIDEQPSFFEEKKTEKLTDDETSNNEQQEINTENDKSEPEQTQISEEKPQENIEKPQSNNIELEISKSPDGNLIIGALNENSGKPINIKIKDSADLKSERRKEIENLGLESADSNQIYDRSEAIMKEGFTVKAKKVTEDDDNTSRFDKLFGADREKNTDLKVIKEDAPDTSAEESDFEESAFEKRFGKNRNQSSSAAVEAVAAGAAKEIVSDNTVAAVTGSAVVTAAAAGTKAVEAVFGKAEKSKGKKSSSEPTRPETEAEFLEGVKADKKLSEKTEIKSVNKTEEKSKREETGKSNDVQKSRREEFMFERESGIIFEHAQKPKQSVQPMKTAFTNIPRLESVNAEEYNRQYEEMKKSMPKNQAYAQRFTGAQSSQPTAKPAVPETKTEPVQSVNNKAKTKKPVKKNGSKKTPLQKKSDDVIEFYKGYEEEDPFTNQAYQNEEILIKDHKKNKGSVGSRFKKSFGKFFSGDVPEDEEDN